ncbi:NADH-quinone oxidoreductase subunit J [bacterium C-53]|nr:NADH-quinone oxidoreductase subunit J [Lachnospiraceae bacterium]NBI03422.1 NADH-quinone oxidoreductase subunit J [Lachnospiraceae bacterium]RKJ09664.1 NADH-quinone oxidoreductase subunit J [bacterium C-53]
MLMDELKGIARENGVVGAGGAGFPSYAKMTEKADTVILNCVECEPLLKLHRQLLALHADEIVQMLDEVRETMGAKEAVIGIKDTHANTIRALGEVLTDYPKVRICAVRATYPMGDEVILIYEATGRVIHPGGIPIDENVVVYNTETMYNLYRAVHQQIPVTNKLVSIVGEIDKPLTVRVPLGTTVKEAVSLAGKITVENPAYVMGGPMMGKPGTENTVITKTTNAIIILPDDHKLVRSIHKNMDVERRRAASSCCQCRTCTEMCPRHALGHPIEPHRIMRAVANHDVSDLSVFANAAYCSSCGLCENYACPQGLSPRSVIAEFKNGLRAAGIRAPKTESSEVVPDRELKKAPVKRLKAKLGLYQYDVPAPFIDTTPVTKYVKILMSQHIGAPAKPFVKVGEQVKKGQKIADAAEGLSVAVHCSIDGVVEKVNEKEVVVRGTNP